MAQVEFQYNSICTIIQCNEDQKMSEICNNFISKSNLDENNLNFIYNDIEVKQFDKNLTFNQMANSLDKTRKKMNILVISNDKDALIKAKNIICHKCGVNNIYNKINPNEIKLTIKIEKDDINKKIYFLDNTDSKEICVGFKENENSEYGFDPIIEEHHHDFLKELNELNTELYINDKKYKYEKYFIPDKEGEYNILLKFNILMTDCSFMFYECKNIINIDLSSFNTQNVTNMFCIFYECSNITNIDLSSFNTQNVKNMVSMFYGCSNITNIDLSSFNTQNVKDIKDMFSGCNKLSSVVLNRKESDINKLIQNAKIIFV